MLWSLRLSLIVSANFLQDPKAPNPKPQERKPKDAECPFKKRFMNRKGLLRGLDNLPSSNVVKPYKNLRKNPTKPLLARI